MCDRLSSPLYLLRSAKQKYLYERYRFSSEGLIYLCQLLEPYIANASFALIVPQTVCIALRYFATGSFLYAVGDAENLSKNTVCSAIHKVAHALTGLAESFVVFPGTYVRSHNLSALSAYLNPEYPGLSLLVTYLMQCPDNLASFLVNSLRAPMTVDVFQCLCDPVVFPEPQCVQTDQGQTLIQPTVSSSETLDSLHVRTLAAGGWQIGDGWRVCSSCVIPELVIDSKLPIEAREVTEGALQPWTVAVHGRSIYERCDAVHLLSLQSLSNI
ncbi:hypothetical protein F7725_007697 [Dissostichus mawsoni]|uniref:Uncharacterized protein n=1 Tax=Dissostichus mawsoni TaxID=36200 RepID=A0A7J5Y534_DISMA|nr:hypothetical protein F7725_007697 [Dissostichus mawsoni]